jgi:Zn-dependent protease/CBS domain-containing protein
MKWSWKIGRFLGIDVYLHTTFFLLIGWIAFSNWFQENSIAAVFTGVGFILALFVSVVLHEYGHSLAARKFGIKTRDITLYPIGGVASLERIPEEPKEELFVALAGPLVNVVIALVLYLGLLINSVIDPLSSISFMGGSFLERLMVTNLILVGFNMIPAFPMDGGRVLRALLAFKLRYSRATQIAASVGQGLALLFGIYGIFSNPFLVFIALFVWMGAQSESRMVQMKSALDGIPVSRVMLTNFVSLSKDDQLSNVVETILTGTQKDFPVVEDGQIVGILTQNGLMKGLRGSGKQALVSSIMEMDFQTIDPSDLLDATLAKLQRCDCNILPVVNHEQLVGLVTMENIGEFLNIQSRLKASRSTIAS